MYNLDTFSYSHKNIYRKIETFPTYSFFQLPSWDNNLDEIIIPMLLISFSSQRQTRN